MRVLIALLLLLMPFSKASAQQQTYSDRLPIIDVHMHAHAADRFGRAGIPNPVTGKPSAATTDDAILRETLKAMDRYNIVKAVAGSSMNSAERWRQAAPDRFIKGAQIDVEIINEVREAFPASGAEPVGMEAGLSRLEKIHPGFIAWAEDLGRTEK